MANEPNVWREGTQTKDEIRAERDALRAEVAGLTRIVASLQSDSNLFRAEVERLKAELARYTGPLTGAELRGLYTHFCGSFSRDHIDAIDSAIRAVRGEKP